MDVDYTYNTWGPRYDSTSTTVANSGYFGNGIPYAELGDMILDFYRPNQLYLNGKANKAPMMPAHAGSEVLRFNRYEDLLEAPRIAEGVTDDNVPSQTIDQDVLLMKIYKEGDVVKFTDLQTLRPVHEFLPIVVERVALSIMRSEDMHVRDVLFKRGNTVTNWATASEADKLYAENLTTDTAGSTVANKQLSGQGTPNSSSGLWVPSTISPTGNNGMTLTGHNKTKLASATASEALDVGDVLTAEHLAFAESRLIRGEAQPVTSFINPTPDIDTHAIDSGFYAVIGYETLEQLRRIPGFIGRTNVPGGRIPNGDFVGSYGRILFFFTNRAKFIKKGTFFAADGFTTIDHANDGKSVNRYLIEKVRKNPAVTSPAVTVGDFPGADAGRVARTDLFGIVIWGQGAYDTSMFANEPPKIIARPPDTPDSKDLLGTTASYGWKGSMGAAVMDKRYMHIIWHGPRGGTGSATLANAYIHPVTKLVTGMGKYAERGAWEYRNRDTWYQDNLFFGDPVRLETFA